MDEFEQRSREVARAILERHGWKRPMTAELKEMREVIDLPYSECKRYLVEEWQNMRIPLLEKDIDKLEKEIDKLEKAVLQCIHMGIDCSDCRLVAGGCTLRTAMRELGVEV